MVKTNRIIKRWGQTGRYEQGWPGRPLRNRIWVLEKKMDHGYLKEEIQREEIAGAKALRQNMQGAQHGRNRVGERESGGDVFRK